MSQKTVAKNTIGWRFRISRCQQNNRWSGTPETIKIAYESVQSGPWICGTQNGMSNKLCVWWIIFFSWLAYLDWLATDYFIIIIVPIRSPNITSPFVCVTFITLLILAFFWFSPFFFGVWLVKCSCYLGPILF